MTNHEELPYKSSSSSAGHSLAEGSYLDTHFACMREEYETMLNSAGIQAGWSVLDAGAGGGSHLPLMSQLVGANGQIDALDLDPKNVEMIVQHAEAGQFNCAVHAKSGSVFDLPYADNQFDLVWCANVTQYLSDEELLQTLHEMKRVTRSGGLIVIKDTDIDGCRQFGPLHPLLLRRVLERISHVQQAAGALRTTMLPGWLRRVGLKSVTYKTFIGERMHPLDAASEAFVDTMLDYWGNLATSLELPEEDIVHWQRLLDKESPTYLRKDPDFYWRETWGVVRGHVA